MKKILFVNDEMTMGGVARILNTLLKELGSYDYELDILVLHCHGELLKELPANVCLIKGSSFFKAVDIPFKKVRFNTLFSKLRLLFYMKTNLLISRIKKERKKLLTKHYDIEFAAKEGFCTIFVASGDSDLKLNWIQVDYCQHNYAKNHMALLTRASQKIDCHIACSQNVLASYKSLFKIQKGIVIHNLMASEKIRSLAQKEVSPVIKPDKINLIAVARFHPQKSLDRLIYAYAQVKDFYHLILIGDGSEKEKLHSEAKRLGVYEYITWLGLQANPYPYIKQADLFVLTSLYEGYPTITLESLLVSTPVLSVKVAGISEQLTKKEMGFIVENSSLALIDKLKFLKDKKDLLLAYKKALQNYDYENEKIMHDLIMVFEGEK